jgi:hypothetical protein
MKAIHRVYEYMAYKQIKPSRFEKVNGFSNGYLGTQRKRKGNLGEDVVIRIVRNYPEINIEWLMLGNGQMLQSKGATNMVNEPSEEYGTNYKDLAEERKYIIEGLKKEVERLEKKISTLKK